MASASFRDSMNSLGWSRRDEDIPVNTAPPTIMGRLQNMNPFGSGGYVRLPTNEGPGAPLPAPSRREEEEGWFARKFSYLFIPDSFRWRALSKLSFLHCLLLLETLWLSPTHLCRAENEDLDLLYMLNAIEILVTVPRAVA
ncbi:unnamed protein product [Periconia digitata]|uniref:Uncharacterized protein n=1 Tax=Periconia digitata TaxID=1303443 RepID=A0A9W4U2L1_9PLEO|nr:unnamed protein product [Periconia digitata]